LEKAFAEMFPEEMANVASGKCPFCSKKITNFRNEISLKEYQISGLCQKCQDEVFGED